MEHILTAKGTMPKPKTVAGASIPEYIEVKATDGNTVAFLSPESDGVVAWIDDEQNGSCTIEIELPITGSTEEQASKILTTKGVTSEVTTLATGDKWQYLTDKYRIYADGKEFVILNPDAVDKQRDGKKLTGKIKAHESWVLLGKKYQTISNDPQNPSPPWGAVIIVSGGAAHGGFDPGSAGSALSYLLQGTGWTVGTVDVTGTYDLETEKESVLYNINQVQEKWGGILIWDSVNKTVSLRDEATYQPYTGYQIRYAKNLKGISRADDYDIVTRLYPFGENDLNIANVNGGLLYLDNQSYSTEVLEGVWYNQDIADQTQLKTQAEKQLAVMCRPRHNYKTEVLDLRSLPGYGHETFKRSDMVDLYDEEFGANARVRIIRYRHNVFQPWLCDMELGDPIEKIQATVAQTVLMAKFYKNVVAPNTSFQNLLKAIINTEATEINGANGDYTLIDGVSTWKDPDTGDLVRITPKGLIISEDGGQTWKTAISGKGFHANAGWVGKLNAGVVTIGADTTFEPGYDPVDNHLYFEYSVDGMNWHPIFNSASDLYMRQKVGDNGTWSEPARIAAVDGVDGVDGQDGTSIVWKGEFTSHPISPQNGWAYRNTADGKSYVYQDGTWYQMTIDGVDGQDGYTPVKGVDYFDGVDGQDGTSAYLWVRYSQNANGNPMTTDPTGAVYIGVATTATPTAPTSYTAYQWSLIKGQDGVPGEKGADGQTSYLHIKYSDDGVNFTGNGGEDVGAYIGTYVDFNPVDSTTFSDYTWNKVKGTPIVWKGELASPPSNPEENWVYRDTDNGYVYIYNGTAWELMVTDGADGIDGAPGVDGMSVYITYHNNPTDSQPAIPTGDGTSGGWYTAPSAQANWMSQKVASNAYSGTWGAPILISGGRKFTSQPVPPYDVGDLWIGGSDGQNTLICTTARSSGSFVASDWERMTEPVANMGVDDRCTALFHFDGSLNSHKGLTPTFTRNSVAYLSDGTQVPAGQARFEPGKFGKGVLIEEGTTNLIANPLVFTGWANTSGMAIQDNDGTFYPPDAKFARITTTAWGAQSTSVAASNGQTWSVSFIARKGTGNGEPRASIMVLSAPSTHIDNISLSFASRDIGNEWVKYKAIFTINNVNTGYIRLRLYVTATNGGYHDFALPQLEQKPYATSFTPGTRSPETLTIPTAGVIDTQKGTIAMWMKMGKASSLAPSGVHDNCISLNAGIWGVYQSNGWANALRFIVGDTWGTSTPVTVNITWDKDDLLFIVPSWDLPDISLTVYNYTKGTTATATATGATYTATPTLAHVNCGDGSAFAGYTNSIIDELRIDKVCRTDEEIAGWYKANAPFYTSEDMKQWPGYMRLETDGLKVYDSSDALRVLVGSWLKDAVRKYGIKIIDGEIYSSYIQTGEEGDTTYISLEPPHCLEVMNRGKYQLRITADGGGGRVSFYDDSTDIMYESGTINAGFFLGGFSSIPDGSYFGVTGDRKPLVLSSSAGSKTYCTNSFHVHGNLSCTGTKPAVHETESYGVRALYARESPELKFVDEGAARLTDGQATIKLDPMFLETIEPNTEETPWLVMLTPYGDTGLYVAEMGLDYIVVRERDNGASNVSFAWSLSGFRKGFADKRMEQFDAIETDVLESGWEDEILEVVADDGKEAAEKT